MLKQETQRIAKTTSKPVKEFATKIEAHEPYAYEMKKTPDGGRCVFLKDNLCTIYECRPVICRFYPFELKPVSFGTGEFLPTDECPGIGKGARALKKDYFEVLVRYLKEMLEGSKPDSVFG